MSSRQDTDQPVHANGSARPALSERDVPAPFRWDVVRDNGSLRVAPVGELDLATRAPLEEAIADLRRTGVDRLILDLRGLSFLDSSGLRLVLELHAAARGDGFELQLVPAPPDIQRIFELTGTLGALPFVTPASWAD